MADSEAKSKEGRTKKIKKRKLRSPEVTERPSKTLRVELSENQREQTEVERVENLEQSEPNQDILEQTWRNLQLILSIQNKELDLQKKVELAFNFVKMRLAEGGTGADQDCETVKLPRVVVFLNDWTQSLLISSEKKMKGEGEKPPAEVTETCLDFRCWEIFKFCLEESLRLQVSLNFSRNLLRLISYIAKDAVSAVNNACLCYEASSFIDERFKLYSTVIDCISLVFSSHGGLSNENLDLWMSTIHAVLELVHKIYAKNLDSGNMGVFSLRFSCLVFEPFAKFLRVHPTRKTGFHDLIDKLLEPLMHLLGVLQNHIGGCNSQWTENLLKLVEEVLSNGLFHPVHMDGFLSLHITGKYDASYDGKSKNSRTAIKSYHRHLFDYLERTLSENRVPVMGSIGELFRLVVARVKSLKRSSVLSAGTKVIGKEGASRHLEDNLLGFSSKISSASSSILLDKSYCLSTFSADARKSLFDFFVQIMEPLLLKIKTYLQVKLEVESELLEVHGTLKAINSLLASFMHERVYLRTEDTSDGACLYFLKEVYAVVISVSTNLLLSSKYNFGNHMSVDMLTLSANEVLVAVGYLVEIEYEVIGDDLVSLWLMLFSYSAIGLSLAGMLNQSLLSSKIEALGCQLINLYSQLRQVNNSVFALCKALRLVTLPDEEGEINHMMFIADLPSEAYARSVGMLLSSQEFKCAVGNAIKSIPEGQTSGCIRQLTADISESLQWMRLNSSVYEGKEVGKLKTGSVQGFYPQAELLGRGLSELYALLLDSVTVTMGNSNLVGVSIKKLISVLNPCMNSLVAIQPDSVNKFLCYVTGRTFDDGVAGSKGDLLQFGFSTYWVFVFFFRLYLSCQSLYRQAISLMSPDSSRKMSGVMGDSFMACSGKELMERTDWDDKGYFSWILQPSASLLVVIQSVSDVYPQDSSGDCSPLIFLLHSMALQRLVDLNRQIKSLEYLLQSRDNLVWDKLVDSAGLSQHRKRSRKWERHILVLRQEAAGLTEFMMQHLHLMGKDQSVSYENATCVDISALARQETEEWDFSICSVNNKSLATSIWWIICQNIDIWCTHAAKKKLKLFLSLLIRTSLPSLTSSFLKGEKQPVNGPCQPKRVTMHQISSELLRDSIFYEQKFVRRYFASRFCRVLEKSVSLSLRDFSSGSVDLNSSPHWPEVLAALDKSSVNASSIKHVTCDCFSDSKPMVHSSDVQLTKICEEQKASPPASMDFTACQSLLNFLCWMPKGCLNSRSLLLYTTYILNIERLVVGGLLECQNILCLHSQHRLFRLFASCRKALKYVIMAASEKMTETSQSTFGPIFPEDSFSALWLFKSVSLVVELQQAVSEDSQVEDLIFSLMDHTSYVFLTLSKYQFSHAVHFLLNAEEPYKEQPFSSSADEDNNLVDSDPCFDSTNCIEAWKSAFLVANSLKEQTQSFLFSLKDAFRGEKVGLDISTINLNRVSSIVSCFSGFLWGLASAINDTAAKFGPEKRLLGWRSEPVSELNACVNAFEEFSNLFLHMFLIDGQQPKSFHDAQSLKMSDYGPDLLDAEEFSLKGSGAQGKISAGRQQQKLGTARACLVSSDIDDESGSARVERSRLKSANFAASVMAEVDSFDFQCINKPLLRRLLNGDYPGAAFSLRQLLIASSAILKLKLHINKISSLSRLAPFFIGISQILLFEFVDMDEMPQLLSFVWLDGVLKYLEELGNHFPSTNPTLSRNVYAKLIELHLRAIGKCITLQGKRATLASHERESSTKTLPAHIGVYEASHTHGPYRLEEFKTRLRMSFKTFIKKPLELHLLSAIQAIERALVGVREGCTTIYDVTTGNAGGGKVSSVVAAGVDCFDLVLEFVSGRKRLSLVKRHIQSLIAGLFNIILHLQNPLIFYGRFFCDKGDSNPDPGSVILMCVEVLIRVAGKHALFQMDAWHVAQSFRIPAALFQDFCQLKLSEAPISSHSSLILDNQASDPLASTNICVVDRYFSIELFAACCRLLHTVLKHHKSECERCIALLEASVSILLYCLETVDADSVARKGYFSWELEEGVKCACFLRRIYEEIRQQKDVLGRHCSLFLSNYISVYVGHGPNKTGIKREIDEALRPGIYALIDACSADDLQYLHAVFGEGPCRNALATLRHDYKLNFQYEGKV